MDETSLKSLLQSKITESVNTFSSQSVKDHVEAAKLYRGDLLGDEQEGRSQVVSHDVAEAIDSMMPALMKIFASGDEVVSFTPQGPEDEDAAAQATDYVNYIWTQQNDGFMNFYTPFKDALQFRLGVLKIYVDEEKEHTREAYQGLTQEELAAVTSGQDVAGSEVSQGMPGEDGSPTFDVVVRRVQISPKFCVTPIPPEEFLYDKRTVNVDESPFLAHRRKVTASDLIEMGFDKATVDAIPQDDDGEFNMERVDRFQDESKVAWRSTETQDPSSREIWINECYLKCDFDGDGIAEMRKIFATGTSNLVILENEEVDDHPFAVGTPTPTQHKMVGISVTDQIKDLQRVNTTLWRQMLDNLYLTNNPEKEVVLDQVNIDDLLESKPGGLKRVKQPGMIRVLETPFVAAQSFQMIEYNNTIREQRTGVTRYNQGLDANSLNKTATGINVITNAAQQRLELIARVFAEGLVKRAFWRLYELICKHQNKAQVIRLRNTYVQIDPRSWSNKMDMTVSVGIGTGNKDQQAAHMTNLLGLSQQIVAGQGGLNGPLVTAENIYNQLAELVKGMGLKNVEKFYTDPGKNPQPPQPPKPDPEMIKIQQQGEIDKAKLQLQAQTDAQKLQLEREKATADFHLRANDQQMNHAMKQESFRADQNFKQDTLAASQKPATTVQFDAKDELSQVAQTMVQIAQSQEQTSQMMAQAMAAVAQASQMMAQAAQTMGAPKRLVRGADGRVEGVETVQ